QLPLHLLFAVILMLQHVILCVPLADAFTIDFEVSRGATHVLARRPMPVDDFNLPGYRVRMHGKYSLACRTRSEGPAAVSRNKKRLSRLFLTKAPRLSGFVLGSICVICTPIGPDIAISSTSPVLWKPLTVPG
ncbi:unnamed protein product, partial [Ixodes pacificus]